MAYTITPLTPHTGAEIRGLDLSRPVDPETRAAVNRAFAEHQSSSCATRNSLEDFTAVQVWGETPHEEELHVPGFRRCISSRKQTGAGKRYSGETFHTDH
jgi:alpha-ketoglutarate-dependent taurine dioxygenase